MALLAMARALTPKGVARYPGLVVGAAIAASLAGLTLAICLWRWVYVAPALAQFHADPSVDAAAKTGAEQAFSLLNQYGGVAIGEHLSLLLTAFFRGVPWRAAMDRR